MEKLNKDAEKQGFKVKTTMLGCIFASYRGKDYNRRRVFQFG